MSANPFSFASLKESISQNFALYVVAILILVGGFMGGSLWQKAKMLEGGTSPTVAQPQAAADQPTAPQGPPAEVLANMPAVTADDHIRGNLNAKVMLVEYSDYECPYCEKFHTTMQQVVEEYGSDVAWVYRHYPLSFHANAQKAAEAAECVASIGGNEAFWKFSDLYYSRTDSSGTGIAIADMPALAGEIGVSQSAVKTCLNGDQMKDTVQAMFDTANSAGISGTPGTLIVTANGVQELIPGALPIEQIKVMIDKYL
ncbi:MAG: thioredoxin domain-containing protein [Patescibacteria group bacterium]|nr:thioredoxin domain-containing protein [Patescibacteria group bacterium]